MLIHPFKPIWDSESRILILGSFPSVKSREEGFYYGHPRNRFWPVMERLFDAELRNTEEKTAFLLSHHIALSDVIAQCDITKSADASIRNAVPQDLAGIISSSRISAVYANGSKAAELYRRFFDGNIIQLPSTSPANVAWTLDKLYDEWKQILSKHMR